MFERYTEKARRVVFFSRYYASQFGALAIEPEHILLGLIREDRLLVDQFCHTPLPKLADIENEIREGRIPGDYVSTSVDLPLSAKAKRVLYQAAVESQKRLSNHIDTEHLLHGLLREENTKAADILKRAMDINGTSAKWIVREASKAKTNDADPIENLRGLLEEVKNLAAAMVSKVARIEAICDELNESTQTSLDKEAEDAGRNEESNE